MLKRLSNIIIDIVFILILCLVTATIYSKLLSGNFLGQEYLDWINMAYRIEHIKNYGLANWTHHTNNGQNMWQAFQFIPQYIVSIYSKFFNLPVSTGILRVSFIFLIFTTVFKYIFLRFLNVTKLVSLVTTVVTLAIPQTAVTIWDFSIFVGLSFLPLFLFLLVKESGSKKITFLPLFIGIGFYIHPLLSFNVLILYTIYSLFSGRIKSIYFYLNLLIVVLVSSYYWVNAFFYTGVSFLDESQTTVNFVRSLLSFSLSGLSQSVLIFVFIVGIFFVLNLGKSVKGKSLYYSTLLYVLILSVWIAITYNYDIVPSILNKFQVTRWVPFIATTAIFYSGYILSNILKQSNNRFVFYFILFVLLGFFFIENYDPQYQTSIMRYTPHTINKYEEPFNEYVTNKKIKFTNKPTVFSLKPSETAYLNFNNAYTDGVYFHFNPNPINRILVQNVINFNGTKESYSTILNYFDIRSIDYVILNDQLDFSKYAYTQFKMNTNEKLKVVYEYKQNNGDIYYVFENTNSFPKAFYIKNTKDLKTFKSSSLNYPYDTKYIDKYVNYFSVYLKNNYDSNDILIADFSKPEEIKFKNTGSDTQIAVISNYDYNWRSDNADVNIFGPQYLLINNIKANGELVLKYQTPLSSKIGFYISIFGFIVWILVNIIHFIFFRKNMKSII